MAKGDHIYYWDGYRYQLDRDYACMTGVRPPADISHRFFEIWANGVITAKEGYAWDGPSGPTFDTKNAMRASLIHDILYQAMAEDLLSWDFREQADDELAQICMEDGMGWFRATVWKKAVRSFGMWFSKHFPEKLQVAP
jgi:hypothetical protein